jgi:hypothetical protein
VVYAAVEELALRMDPFVSEDNLVLRLPISTRLIALEPKSQQQAKIGQVNQWLKVQETQHGYEGFVAAWYVSLAPAPQEAAATGSVPQTLPSSGPGQVVVYATAPALAFRNQPVVMDSSLIRWALPNTQFVVLDSPEQASARIGVDNTWLHVKDVSGQEGYVAGAYVALASPGMTAGARPKDNAAQQPAGQAKLVVRPTVDGLALRSQPAISPANMIKREPLAADLALLDPPDQARVKIGAVNQWLKVRDIQGSEGYVAAWYVA